MKPFIGSGTHGAKHRLKSHYLNLGRNGTIAAIVDEARAKQAWDRAWQKMLEPVPPCNLPDCPKCNARKAMN